jgi:hypothetical protein
MCVINLFEGGDYTKYYRTDFQETPHNSTVDKCMIKTVSRDDNDVTSESDIAMFPALFALLHFMCAILVGFLTLPLHTVTFVPVKVSQR